MGKSMGTGTELPGYLTSFTNYVTSGKLLNLKMLGFLIYKNEDNIIVIVSTSLGYKSLLEKGYLKYLAPHLPYSTHSLHFNNYCYFIGNIFCSSTKQN